MTHFHAAFTGRKVGSIGVTYGITCKVSGNSPYDARINLYAQYEHIFDLKLSEIFATFTMDHPMIHGDITVIVRLNQAGTKFYEASTSSGILIGQMTFKDAISEIEEQVYRAISTKLSRGLS